METPAPPKRKGIDYSRDNINDSDSDDAAAPSEESEETAPSEKATSSTSRPA